MCSDFELGCWEVGAGKDVRSGVALVSLVPDVVSVCYDKSIAVVNLPISNMKQKFMGYVWMATVRESRPR